MTNPGLSGVPQIDMSRAGSTGTIGERTTKTELWSWWAYNFAFEPISIVGFQLFIPLILESLPFSLGHLQGFPGRACEKQKPCVLFSFGSIDILTSSFAYYIISLSVLFQALVFVSVGAMADYGPYRKRMLIISSFIGATSALLMVTAWKPETFWYAAVLTIVMNVAFGTATVFYNAYLPLLAKNYRDSDLEMVLPESKEDVFEKTSIASSTELELKPSKQLDGGSFKTRSDVSENTRLKRIENISSYISTRGFIVGYVGALLVLIASAVFVFVRPESLFNLELCVAFCGVWWIVFSIYPLWVLKTRPGPKLPAGTNYLTFSWKKVGQTLSKCRELPNTFWFLLSFFLYSDGFATMGSVAVIFAKTEMAIPDDQLVLAVLISPCASVLGNYFFFYLQKLLKISDKTILLVLLGVLGLIPCWGIAGIFTMRFGLHQNWEIYAFAAWYGFLAGALQSFSRVIFSHLIPPGEESEFFSLYAITDKGSSWVGPLLQSLLADVTHKSRAGLFVLALMIWIPIPILITLVDMDRGIKDAKNFHSTSLQHPRH